MRQAGQLCRVDPVHLSVLREQLRGPHAAPLGQQALAAAHYLAQRIVGLPVPAQHRAWALRAMMPNAYRLGEQKPLYNCHGADRQASRLHTLCTFQ